MSVDFIRSHVISLTFILLKLRLQAQFEELEQEHSRLAFQQLSYNSKKVLEQVKH
jgi:hypothetical protein